MSWLFSQALVEAFSEGTSLAGEPSAPLSGNPTQLAYCAPDKTTAFSRLSRFGMTFKPLTADRGEALLMSYLAAFPVRTSPSPEKAQAWTESDQECGNTWRGWLAKFDPATSSWKTAQCSLLEDLTEFSVTLPRCGMTRNGLLWELPMLERRTSGIDSGLWPTPVSIDAGSGRFNTSIGGKPRPTLALMARKNLWPTPRSCSAMAATITPESAWNPARMPNLETVVGRRQWPTPVATMSKGSSPASLTRKDGRDRSGDRLDHAVMASDGGQLNPMWVEWLMGWPLGWTDLKPLETDKCHCARPEPSNCLPLKEAA